MDEGNCSYLFMVEMAGWRHSEIVPGESDYKEYTTHSSTPSMAVAYRIMQDPSRGECTC